MNILLLSREYPPHVYGGAGVVVDHLSRALARRATVEVRCFGPNDQTAPNLTVRGYAPWERLAGGPEAPYAPALEALSIGLAMARDPVTADVVHTHTWYVGLGGVLVRSVHGVPLVVTLHSLEPLRPWKVDQLGSGYLVSSWAEREAVEQADRVIAVSAQMRADILANFRVDPDRVVVIHNGVDAQAFARTARRDALDRYGVREPYVLFVGRISEQKGIFQLLAAARALPEGVPLVLCASSPDTPELKTRLEAAVADRPDVRWINAMLPVDEVVQLYSHAAVFVCPSVYEPFGLINLEAMACGTPVVASRVGGIPEVVVDGETGLLVEPGDVTALAQALGRILTDPALAARMGQAGRRRVEAYFSWDRIADRTLAVYQEAIAAHRRDSGPAR
ncbi:MAG TPA: glycogen synthase [Candidatus Dormibacteraeota bacterium]|nr:glycogen synthase [Candidatus Dormibacteraeota bacterium]